MCQLLTPREGFIKKKQVYNFLNNSTVRRLKNGTPVFALFLCEILIKFDTHMINLMKFWLRYLRLKTIDIFQKSISINLFHCQLSLIFLHQIQRSGKDF